MIPDYQALMLSLLQSCVNGEVVTSDVKQNMKNKGQII